jgi:hypothetical protein
LKAKMIKALPPTAPVSYGSASTFISSFHPLFQCFIVFDHLALLPPLSLNCLMFPMLLCLFIVSPPSLCLICSSVTTVFPAYLSILVASQNHD